MLPDFELIIKHFPENRDLHIYPVADIHLGAAEHMEDAWKEFCGKVLEDPDAYIILGGDLINNATRSSVSNIFEETMRPSEQKRKMAEMLKPLRDRILCAVPGNHEGRSGRDADDDPLYDILCKIDREDVYRENIAFLKIQIGNIKGDGLANPTYMLTMVHGNGGGILTGGAVNRSERFGYAISGNDILITGHTHKPYTTHPGKIVIDSRNNKVSIKPFHVVSCSSWLEFGGYAARKNLLPSAHIGQKIILSGKSKNIKIEIGG